MENEWYTITQTSEKTNIPPDTVRRYVRNHRSYLKTRKRGNGYQIHINSLKVIHEIRRLYDKGLNIRDVDEQLSFVHPMTIEVIDEQEQRRQTIDVASALHEMKAGFMQVIEVQQKELQKVKEELASARQEIQELKMSEKKHEQTLNSLNDGINDLIESVNEVKDREWSTLTLDEVREVMYTEKKPGFFARFFGK